MNTLPNPPFAFADLAVQQEVVKSESYFWDNAKRGNTPYVIVQQTLRGCGRFRFQGRAHRVPMGSLFIAIVPEKSTYYFSAKDASEWAFRWINFEGDSARQLWGALRSSFGPVLSLPQGSMAERSLGRLIKQVSERQLAGTQAHAESAHSVFVSCWLQQEAVESGFANPAAKLRELIRERYPEPVNIKQLCAQAGQSREHLTREFKKCYGIEPAAYLRQLRLSEAERYLIRSNLSIAEIARRTGHAGPTQFARSFVAANGKSPREFRDV